MCEEGDLVGWRLEGGDAVLGFEPFGDGVVRITRSPSLTPVSTCDLRCVNDIFVNSACLSGSRSLWCSCVLFDLSISYRSEKRFLAR